MPPEFKADLAELNAVCNDPELDAFPEVAAALRGLAQDFANLGEAIDRNQTEMDRMKGLLAKAEAEKAEMVKRNAMLRNRLDLPLERVAGYDQMMAERDQLRNSLETIRAWACGEKQGFGDDIDALQGCYRLANETLYGKVQP